MMNRDEIIDAARNVSDFLKMGEPLDTICDHLTRIQPKYAKQWKVIGRESSQGARLGNLLRQQKLWPDAMCAAVDAGEESGNMETVLESIMEFQQDLQGVTKIIKSKILGPSIFIVAGICIFIGFMTFVLPGIAKGIKDPDARTGLIAISDTFVMLKDDHMLTVIGVFALAVVGIIGMIKSPAVQLAFMKTIDSIPGLGDGLRSVMFGLWAKFMVILDEAQNIPIAEMISISSGILPSYYRASTDLLEKEVSMPQGAEWATNHSRWRASDPRQKWPVRLKISMNSAAATGNIKGALGRAAEPMVRDGIANIEKGLTLFNLIAMAIAAGGILTPMAGMMLVQLDVVNSMK